MRVIRSASVATALALLSGFAMAGQPGAVHLPIAGHRDKVVAALGEIGLLDPQ